MIRWVPVWAFLGAYVLLCVVGSVLLLWRIEPLAGAFEHYFSKIPVLSGDEKSTFLIVLFGSPCAFVAGYWIAGRIVDRLGISVDFRDNDIGRSAIFAVLAFCASFAWSVWSLYGAGAFFRLHSWSDLPAWVHSRLALFSSLSFFEFVNIYVFLPSAAALVVLAVKPRNVLEHAVRWLPTLLTLGVDVLLYQKKPALLALLLVGGALWLSKLLRRPERLATDMIMGAGAGVALVAVYFAFFLPSVLMNWGSPLRADIATMLREVMSYATVILFTRIPAPALHYPIVFPKQQPFYNLDLGQDILGFGTMPDDNHVVWRVMYPTDPGVGAAPFNFVLYSQGGIAVSLIGSAVLGALIAVCWTLAVASRGGTNVRSLAGFLLLLFTIHLTIDSVRNTAIVSYGFVWGGLFVLAVYLFETFLITKRVLRVPGTVLTRRYS